MPVRANCPAARSSASGSTPGSYPETLIFGVQQQAQEIRADIGGTWRAGARYPSGVCSTSSVVPSAACISSESWWNRVRSGGKARSRRNAGGQCQQRRGQRQEVAALQRGATVVVAAAVRAISAGRYMSLTTASGRMNCPGVTTRTR